MASEKNWSWDIVRLSKKGQSNCLGISTPLPGCGQYLTRVKVFSKQVPSTSSHVCWIPTEEFKPPTPATVTSSKNSVFASVI